MFPPLDNHPGLLFVVATLLPVVSVLILLVVLIGAAYLARAKRRADRGAPVAVKEVAV